SVTGTVQPVVLDRALDREALAAGLGARFLFAYPPRRKREWTENEIGDKVVESYQGLIRDLLALGLDEAAKRKPHLMGLCAGAQRRWLPFYNEWGNVQEVAEGEQAAAFAKIEAYASRLMLLHHVVSHTAAAVGDKRAITEASARAGIALARWFAYEAGRIYTILP